MATSLIDLDVSADDRLVAGVIAVQDDPVPVLALLTDVAHVMCGPHDTVACDYNDGAPVSRQDSSIHLGRVNQTRVPSPGSL